MELKWHNGYLTIIFHPCGIRKKWPNEYLFKNELHVMIGKTISHYKILEKLGEGEMGVVYKAEDIKLKRTAALKFLSSELTWDPESKKRLIHEAQAVSYFKMLVDISVKFLKFRGLIRRN